MTTPNDTRDALLTEADLYRIERTVAIQERQEPDMHIGQRWTCKTLRQLTASHRALAAERDRLREALTTANDGLEFASEALIDSGDVKDEYHLRGYHEAVRAALAADDAGQEAGR